MTERQTILRARIRWLTALFIFGLVLSGVTAIPLTREMELAIVLCEGVLPSAVMDWLGKIVMALHEMERFHPFLFYGADWLAFGHFVIALAFVGAWRDPVRNRWLFDFGLIACALVLPYAFIFGALRGIPWWWRLIDCSFGGLGAVPLWFCRRYSRDLEALTSRGG